MKKTTYILLAIVIGEMLLFTAGAVGIYFMPAVTTNNINFSKSLVTVDLPSCKAVKFINENNKELRYASTKMEINHSKSAVSTLTIPNDLKSHLKFLSSGDTLNIVFKFDTAGSFNKVNIGDLKLSINDSINNIYSEITNINAEINDISLNNLKVNIIGDVSMNNCKIENCSLESRDINIISGQIQDLYLNLKNNYDWKIDPKKSHIKTLHITAALFQDFNLEGYDEVIFTPTEGSTPIIYNSKKPIKITKLK